MFDCYSIPASVPTSATPLAYGDEPVSDSARAPVAARDVVTGLPPTVQIPPSETQLDTPDTSRATSSPPPPESDSDVDGTYVCDPTPTTPQRPTRVRRPPPWHADYAMR